MLLKLGQRYALLILSKKPQSEQTLLLLISLFLPVIFSDGVFRKSITIMRILSVQHSPKTVIMPLICFCLIRLLLIPSNKRGE